MTELRDDIKAVLTAASHLVELTSISIIHEPPLSDVRRLIMSLPDQLTVDAVRRAIVGLEQAVSACGAKSQENIESTEGVLEAIPFKPLDVEVRQWALSLAMQVYAAPFDETSLQMRERAADRFVRYAMTGSVPPTDAPEAST